MIVLDINVVSEPLKGAPDAGVLSWLDRQHVETLYLAASGLAELLVGIEYLPEGKRKHAISGKLSDFIIRHFAMRRILSFDQAAARQYAILTGRARAAGRPITIVDGQIAAIALSNGFMVATRDTAPYKTARVTVIDPWIEGLR